MRSAGLKEENVRLLHQLAASGCPVDLDLCGAESGIKIVQSRQDDVTRVFELPDGRAGYILDVRITNEGKGRS